MAGKNTVFDNGGYVGIKAQYGVNPGALTLVTSGLTVYLDAANPLSYPGTGTTWTDMSGNGYNFTVQAAAYTASPTPHFNFEGSYGWASRSTDVPPFANATVMAFSTIKNSTADWRTLLRGASNDHQVIIGGDNLMGMYDNEAGGYLTTSFNITTLPNPYTQFNCLTWRFAQNSSPYYRFSFNGGATNYDITDSRAGMNNGFVALGAYQGNSQFFGKIAAFLYYNRQLTADEITQNYLFYKTRLGI